MLETAAQNNMKINGLSLIGKPFTILLKKVSIFPHHCYGIRIYNLDRFLFLQWSYDLGIVLLVFRQASNNWKAKIDCKRDVFPNIVKKSNSLVINTLLGGRRSNCLLWMLRTPTDIKESISTIETNAFHLKGQLELMTRSRSEAY